MLSGPLPSPYCLLPLTPPSEWSLLSLSRVQRPLLSVYFPQVCCVLDSRVPSIWSHWQLGQVTTCSLRLQFPAPVLYSIVLYSLYNRVLLSILHCIVFSVTLHSHIKYNKGTMTNKQTSKQTNKHTLLNVSLLSAYHYTIAVAIPNIFILNFGYLGM